MSHDEELRWVKRRKGTRRSGSREPPATTETSFAKTRDTSQDRPNRQTLDEPAAVRFTGTGTPLALRWRGSIWQVIGEPIQWSSSISWWEPDSTTRGGRGSVITTRSWRFRVQTGPASPVLEFDISTDPRWQGWRLHRVAGATGF